MHRVRQTDCQFVETGPSPVQVAIWSLVLGYSSIEQRRDYQRRWLLKRRTEYLEYLGGKCVNCGTFIDLEFHHKVPEDKEFDIAILLSRQRAIALKELDKCELRCFDCHKEQHATVHGTTTMWNNGCRCDLCTEAKRLNRFMRYKSEKRHEKYVRLGT